MSRIVVRKNLRTMYGTKKNVVLPKLQIQPNVDFFEKLLKDIKLKRSEKSQNLSITPRRVYQLLHESPNLVYRNWKIAPALTAKH